MEISNSAVTMIGFAPGDTCEEIDSQGFNRLWVAVRHGRKFMLKGLKPEYAGKPAHRQKSVGDYLISQRFYRF